MLVGFKHYSKTTFLVQSTFLRSCSCSRSFLATRRLSYSVMGLSKVPPQAPPTFNHTVADLDTITDISIKRSKNLLDQVAAIDPSSVSFQNVLIPLVHDENRSLTTNTVLGFYQHVSTDKEMRDASSKAEEKFEAFAIESAMRDDVYSQVKSVYDSKPDDIEPEEMRLLDKIYRGYIRRGLALRSEEREELKQMQEQLSTICISFSKVLGEETGGVWFTKEELQGVPDDTINGFEIKTENGTTFHKMTFKYPDLFPTLRNAKLEETRKRAFVGDQNKNAACKNVPLMTQAVKIRHQIATKLGYSTWANYVLEERMAKSADTVDKFLQELRQKIMPGAMKELQDLENLKKTVLEENKDSSEPEIKLWDMRYLDQLMRKKFHDIDAELVSEYFPLEQTYTNMLGIFSGLLGLNFEEVKKSDDAYSVWHEDCKQFAVWNSDTSQTFVGWLYFDLFPREGKYGHAANFGLSPGYINEKGERVYPATALVCNFTKPTKDKPSLLKHDEVVTFFHELGHGIHDLVARTKFGRFHGTAVSRDFVEAPSQMLENWCYLEDQLQFLSSHYLRTDEKITLSLAKRIKATKHLNDGLFNLRQLHFASFDLKIHTAGGELSDDDITQLWNNMRRDICLIGDDGITTFGHGGFAHLMGGYDSGYYGYLWSLVYSYDMFYTIFKTRPMDHSAGQVYREKILVPGGSRDEMESLKSLLGRDPNSAAFTEELGIA